MTFIPSRLIFHFSFIHFRFILFGFISGSIFMVSCSQGSKTGLVNVVDCGVEPNGKTGVTHEIQKIIEEVSQNHGGTIYFPAGTYIISTLFLKDNVTLWLETGCVLKADSLIEHYPKLSNTSDKDRHPYHLIVAENGSNIHIKGHGTIDGFGHAFWLKERKSADDFYVEKKDRPSPMIEFKHCSNISIHDIEIKNSPGWTLHLNQCSQVNIQNIHINNNLLGPNTDGIDINGSEDVLISGCHIKAGDDAIVLKTTQDSKECRNIVVSNCILETNCVAMKLGTESHHNFENVLFENIIVKRSSRVFSIICNDGATVEHVKVNHVIANTNSGWPLNRIIELNANKRNDSSKAGRIAYVDISDVDVVSDGRILMGSSNGSLLEDVRLSKIRIQYPYLDDPLPLALATENDPFYFRSLPELRGARYAICAQNIQGLQIEDVVIHWPTYPITKDWRLFTSKHFLNQPMLKNHSITVEEIKEGKNAVSFGRIWKKNVTDLTQ